MTAEPQTFDISEIPELARAVAAARASDGCIWLSVVRRSQNSCPLQTQR
jgi:hypothetical protein